MPVSGILSIRITSPRRHVAGRVFSPPVPRVDRLPLVLVSGTPVSWLTSRAFLRHIDTGSTERRPDRVIMEHASWDLDLGGV